MYGFLYSSKYKDIKMSVKNLPQGVDGSALKPALVKDTNYMVEKTYHMAPYLDAFGAYLMPQ